MAMKMGIHFYLFYFVFFTLRSLRGGFQSHCQIMATSATATAPPGTKFNELPLPVQRILSVVVSEEPVVTLIALTLAWLAGSMELPWSFVLLLLMWLLWWRWGVQFARRKRAETWSVLRVVQEPKAAALVLADCLPPWAVFPTVERAQWLSKILESVWPHMSKQISRNVKEALDPILEMYQPAFLTKLCLSECNLGPIAPFISGIETHASERETVIDLHLVWPASDSEVIVSAGFGLVELEAKISGLHFQAILRVVLGPHVPKWPSFGGISCSFVGKPLIDFSLAAAKVPLDAIPGFQPWLDSFIRTTLSSYMVYPKRIVIPMIKDEDVRSMLHQDSIAEPCGTIIVVVKSADSLPKKFLQHCTTFVSMMVTSGEKESHTVVVENDRNPNYQDKRATFTVFNVPNERLVLRIMSVSSLAQVGATSHEIGRVELFTSVLLATQGEQSHKLRLHCADDVKERPKITFTTNFRDLVSVAMAPPGLIPELGGAASLIRQRQQLVNDTTGGGSVMGAAAANASVSNAGFTSSAAAAAAAAPGSPLAGLPQPIFGDGGAPPSSSSSLAGVLLIRLLQCSRLPQTELMGQIMSLGLIPDVYVKLSIGHIGTKSATARRTLSPVFKSDFFLDFRSALDENLTCEVYATQKLHSDLKIAWADIPLIGVLQTGGRCSQRWTLTPSGEIDLDLRMMLRT